ncbi:pyridoxamine 5'-phosphate oxidase family protein [Kitasatospora sp. NPDC096147]|uniref:pyridoxamine 5'-phosphate oxidase family protein n=1 Tax=Kitasatospora sp. NPDC096147 TaxID=3364093 RepID=UPI0037FD1800
MTTSTPPDPAFQQALAAHTTVTLAYADADGPQACAVLYAPTERATLLFLSSPTTRHGRALDGARAAFTVQADGQEWRTITGLQGHGTCRTVTDPAARDAAWAVYAARFTFLAEDPALTAALARTALWELTPTDLRLIDNSRGFGDHREWSA